MESITTVLTSSYCALSEFSLFASGKVCPDLERLLAITGYQSYLQKITTLMYKVEQLLGCFQPVITSTPPYSLVHQMSLIDLNLKKRKTTLGLSPVSALFSYRKLSPSTFLSLPCSQNQTLILKSFETRKR